MRNKIIELLKRPGFEDHKFPVTRRELLQLGIISSAFVALRPLRAFADVANSSPSPFRAPGARNIPFLVFDLQGGAALPGNFLVGGAGGSQDLLADYNSLGWDPRASDALDMTYGLPMSKQRSKMLQGLNSAIPLEKRENFKFGSFLNFSLDDTSSNTLSAVNMIAKIHGGGSILQSGFGMEPSESGGNSRGIEVGGVPSPTYVNDFSAIEGLGRISGISGFSNDQMQLYFKQLAASDSKEYSQDVVSASRLLDTKRFDPRSNADLSRIYNLKNSNLLLEAAIVYNALIGNTGPSVIQTGDCDYHDKTGTTGDRKDLEIGGKIGRAVAAAAALNSPLYIQVITDGGVYAPDTGFERRWIGDSNQRSMSVVGLFDPQGPVKQRRDQVGAYLKTGIIDQTTMVGASSQKMIYGVVANYLNLHNRMGEFADLIGNRGMSKAEIESLLIF
jgi:hypothetical protein